MIRLLDSFDIFVYLACLLLLVFSSFVSVRRGRSAAGYFMADRALRWWSVAGSIYGTNVSLSQIIGMLGIGYSIGFAQSHYELLAIPAILALVYLFIPVYRQANFFTLSEYLAERYDDRARLLYTLAIMAIILILLVGGLYIGSRQLGLLFRDTPLQPTYLQGILLIAAASCLLTFFGGMEAVVKAENIITVLMVLAVLTVGWCTLRQPSIGGLFGLLELDASSDRGLHKMRLYLPSNHPDLPWTGVFSGLLVLHGFFWTTNQFEVQRVLAARTDRDAQLGAIGAGFLKLTIPFFSIAAGVAAAYLFRYEYDLADVKPDDAFVMLLSKVVPSGYGLMGLILAGFTGAVFSSMYSMLNSAATISSVDLYRRYVHPLAADARLVWIGRISVLGITLLASILAWLSFDPNADGNFFLTLSRNSSYLKPGIVSAFFLGVVWKRTHPASAAPVMLAAPFLGLGIEWFYAEVLANDPFWIDLFGPRLNFLHRVFAVFVLCLGLQVFLSLRMPAPEKFSETLQLALPWMHIFMFILMQVIILWLIRKGVYTAASMAMPAAVASLLLWQAGRRQRWNAVNFWGALLAAFTLWALYRFV
ncbi:MAG: sodium/solute symporter [Bacteroidetes bacterium]|nr:sodium/solute symporter [Bacteroidota bacterium]